MNTPLAAALRCSLIFLVSAAAYADSAQWNLNPTSADWNTADNWTPTTVPNGPGAIATFALSNITNVSISADTEVNEIAFTSAATNPYSIIANPGLTLTLSGAGITNNSGITQNFLTAVRGSPFAVGQIVFTNGATAGTSTRFTNGGSLAFEGAGGFTEFFSDSNAGNGNFVNDGGFVNGAIGGVTEFFSSSASDGTFINSAGLVSGAEGGYTNINFGSTAANASCTNMGASVNGAEGGLTGLVSATAGNGTFINNGGLVNGAGGGMTFLDETASAGSGTFINNGGLVNGAGGGTTFFDSSSTADSATLIGNGGTGSGEGGSILFIYDSTGGTSRVEVFGNGRLDIGFHHAPGLTIGSIEGDGDAFLGANNLTVGSNNLSTTFSGAIQDGGFGGSFTKIRTRTLILKAVNPYSGVTNINRGVLQVDGPVLSDTSAIQDGGAGGGSFRKIGTGTLILSGANTYTGNTNINGGVLQIDGSITSNTFINHRSTLAGTGTINGTVTNTIGKVSPGGALGEPGVLIVGNNYMQMARASLVIQIGGAGAGQVSVLDVQGNANLDGSLQPVLLNGFVPSIGQSFTIMNYASFAGFFSCIQHQVFDHGRKRWALTYYPTSAVLTAVENSRP
ncbi:MAG TPA: autotransporter-associated beta strand repeat-containing protein [Candidatus Udaeobacter sp.]